MLEWKASANGASALMLDGVRRVGKSYIAEEFAKSEYKSYLLIDFSKVNREVKEAGASEGQAPLVVRQESLAELIS